MAWNDHWVHSASAGWDISEDSPAYAQHGTEDSDTQLFVGLHKDGRGVFNRRHYPRIRFGFDWPLAGHRPDSPPGLVATVLVRMASIPFRRGGTVGRPPGLTTLDIYEHDAHRWTRWNIWDQLSPVPANRYGTLEVPLGSDRWFRPEGPLSVVVGFGGYGTIHLASVGLRVGFPDLHYPAGLSAADLARLVTPGIDVEPSSAEMNRRFDLGTLRTPDHIQEEIDQLPLERFIELAQHVATEPGQDTDD